MTPANGNRYLYRTITGRVYHVDVVKAGRFYSLCRWRVDSIDLGYRYEKVGYRANWKLLEDVL